MKKALSGAVTVLSWIVAAAAVLSMLFSVLSSLAFDRNDRGVFGLRFYVVRTDSMAATDFAAGDLIVVRTVDPTALGEGDIVTFVSRDPDSYGETVTHKIRPRDR